MRPWLFLFVLACACSGASGSGLFGRSPIARADAAMKAGRFAEAEDGYREAVARAERIEPADRSLEQSLSALADFYCVRGEPAKAEPLYKRAITAAEAALGPGDIEVARRARDLALLYHAANRLSEAEPWYRRALEVTERAMGKTSREAALRRKDVEAVLQDMGKKR